jgi:putative membrane-bound dehydrogenase-like protein
MSLADGLQAHLVAAEPIVRQPVAIEFDDRGRLWVIQYLQYPNPAGLKRVSVDRYSRTTYDRIPEPPPRGPKGADRITILEDTDGDGLVDRSRDFVTGLNLASGLAFGYDGVFVLQAPYLLFYPDHDRDDRPDGDPEVLITGFGLEDAHSVANSLTWGPDGWLYGLQGSTVTASVRGIDFQQGVWRYHPRSKRFELFCEGGGNMWGLDFDRTGQLFASTNVGGFVMLHGVQGAYYWKAFSKHGPLHNAYAFGYFDHVAHANINGGHVAVGGLFYEADALPPAWRGRYIAADLLDHSMHAHEVSPCGTTFRAHQVADVLRANDTWFAPTDLTLGPDGALYVADWHDQRTAHPDPDADWDRTNGRIFAITAQGRKPAMRVPIDLATRTNAQLVALLDHTNVWYRRRARRLLAERRASDVAMNLRSAALSRRGPPALEALWALYGCAGFDDGTAQRLLKHPDPEVRAWCIRLLADEPPVPADVAARLVELAAQEPAASVRAQLACTAQRLPPQAGLDVAAGIVSRDLDADDPHLPLLLWWAVERHAISAEPHVLQLFARPMRPRSAMSTALIRPNLVRRYALEPSRDGDEACLRLLSTSDSGAEREALLKLLDQAMHGRTAKSVAPALATQLIDWANDDPRNPILTRHAARMRNKSALARAIAIAGDPRSADADRVLMLDLFGELRNPTSAGLLIDLATKDDDPASVVRPAALDALAHLDDPSIPRALLAAYPRQRPSWRSRARGVLLGRASWARDYLMDVDNGKLSSAETTLEQLASFPALEAPDLAALVRKHWGTTRGATREERLAEVRRLNNDLRAAAGDPASGRKLFQDRCANCHRLNGVGETIGPDLTFTNRKDRDYLLVSLVDPSGAVRKEYQSSVVATKDGRVLTGRVLEESPEAIVLADSKGVRTRLPRPDIDEVKDSDVSLMPESLYKEFTPAQLRDLFSYLQLVPASSP